MAKDIQRQIDQTIRGLEVSAENGDAEAQCDSFVLLNAKAMEEYDTAIFDKAEGMLRRSDDAGWPEAIEKLKSQSIRRRGFEGRVKRHGKH